MPSPDRVALRKHLRVVGDQQIEPRGLRRKPPRDRIACNELRIVQALADGSPFQLCIDLGVAFRLAMLANPSRDLLRPMSACAMASRNAAFGISSALSRLELKPVIWYSPRLPPGSVARNLSTVRAAIRRFSPGKSSRGTAGRLLREVECVHCRSISTRRPADALRHRPTRRRSRSFAAGERTLPLLASPSLEEIVAYRCRSWSRRRRRRVHAAQ